ncbi:MAG TPA: CaiB/BaiF CoA-transferase family protein [Acidimicrobiia bacterium]|nr:CaiB/BaiF CoA-transferase family protein [Acidimicrobiia bacterium]
MTVGMLDGITVLDLASVGPAARASRWLADYGARVVKIGPVPDRRGVQIVPPFHSYSAHRGMQRALFDLKAPDGRDAFLRLADTADVVLESFRPGVVDRLGIGWQAVSARNPRAVYCSTTGFGQSGPHAHWAGHDLNYLAVGGYLDCTGPGDHGGPPIPGATVADSAGGGMHAVMAILAALVRRATTGSGAYLDVAVADGVLALMALQVDEYLATGDVPGPRHGLLTGRYACYDSYPASDGKWLTVAAIEPRFWENLCCALDLDRWIVHQTDDAVQDDIRADLRTAFGAKTRDEWTALLSPGDTCVAPVLTVPELVDDPQFAARRAFVEVEHPDHGTFRQVGPTFAGTTAAPARPYQVRDATETDTDELLLAIGYTPDQCAALRRAGAIA